MFSTSRSAGRWRTATLCARTAALTVALGACDSPGGKPVYDVANGCYAVGNVGTTQYLQRQGSSYQFTATRQGAEAFTLRPTDLGHYVLYARDRHYLAAHKAAGTAKPDWQLLRTASYQAVDIAYHQAYSDAEWEIVTGAQADQYQLRHLNSGLYLGAKSLVEAGEAAALTLAATAGCTEYPELALDAQGTVRKGPWSNGDVYGAADVHSHMFTNVGFGGGGIFHGAPFHRMGVEHALTDCTEHHGENGQRDIVGFFLGGSIDLEVSDVGAIFIEGKLPQYNHATDGYPTFSSWPNPRKNPTHQQQYYRWIERAYMGGLRLVVQLATGQSALCELLVGLKAQTAPYGCNDMDSVDIMIEQVHAMERYIDAQHGGPGQGWFRIVRDSTEARTVINDGKMAVVLGIEISNLFDCFLTPPPGKEACTTETVQAAVAEYVAAGIRVVFPVHKLDTGFSPGDGSRGAIQLGNVINSGHESNFVEDCPDMHHNFDSGDVTFGGLNRPRSNYFAPPLYDMHELTTDPVRTLLPMVPRLAEPALKGDYCQGHGLTDLGRTLMQELMAHGVVIDIAHLPRKSTVDALGMLRANKYPAISTHGLRYDGAIFDNGGFSNNHFGSCGDPARPGSMGQVFRGTTDEIVAANGLPAQPFSFDLNGFAGSRAPRFGPESGCAQPQTNPVEYPFTSFDGGVSFESPTLGRRSVDFNTEGMLHIGLLPELIEDARRDGMSDADLEPLFHSAESFLRMWATTESKATK